MTPEESRSITELLVSLGFRVLRHDPLAEEWTIRAPAVRTVSAPTRTAR